MNWQKYITYILIVFVLLFVLLITFGYAVNFEQSTNIIRTEFN